MSDDFTEKLKQFAEMLSQGDASENMKNIMGMFDKMGSNGVNGDAKNNDQGERKATDDAFETFMKAKQMMERLRVTDDPRANLLSALKPYMNSKRQTKIDQCMKLLTMTKLMGLMNITEDGGKK